MLNVKAWWMFTNEVLGPGDAERAAVGIGSKTRFGHCLPQAGSSSHGGGRRSGCRQVVRACFTTAKARR